MTFFSVKDWAKPGPYDQPMVNTLRRKKDKETPVVVDSNGSVTSDSSPVSATSLAQAAVHAPNSSASEDQKNKTVVTPPKVSLKLKNFICCKSSSKGEHRLPIRRVGLYFVFI